MEAVRSEPWRLLTSIARRLRHEALLVESLIAHQTALRACQTCKTMIGPVITGRPVASKIFLIGQAPGRHEGAVGQPFGWRAGKTLFGWFETLGVSEDRARSSIYFAAVCRCFPGAKPGRGDRVPSRTEIAACRPWLKTEIELLAPQLLIPVGRLAIEQVLGSGAMDQWVGHSHRVALWGTHCDVVPLPHPSGASPWHRIEPGRSLLSKALDLLSNHSAWRSAFGC